MTEEELPESKPKKKKRFYRRWYFIVPVILVILLVGLWVASELVIPRVAESYAERKIKEKYPAAKDVSVSVTAFPAIKLAFKRYDSLTVKASEVTVQNVNFNTITLKSNDWPRGTFQANIAQSEIVRFFSLKNSWLIDPKLTVDQNGILITGKVNIGPRVVNVATRGTLEAVDGKKIYFRPADIQVSDVIRQSDALAEVRKVIDATAVFTVREDLPYSITRIVAEPGNLTIYGTVDLEKALNVKL